MLLSPSGGGRREDADLGRGEDGERARSPSAESSAAAVVRGISEYNEKDYDELMQNASSLPDPSLLRGMPVAGMLHRCARILGSSDGTAEDYAQSEVVSELDSFLSHTWSTPRGKKFMTLLIYHNLWPALIVSVCCACATSVLVARGALPTFYIGVRDPGATMSMLCQAVGVVTLMLTLFVWHEVCGLFGFKRHMVFLDKACVHQTDTELKRKSIQSLAAFLNNSRSLVVLYSDVYLKRLWTVYEFSSFLLLKPIGACLDILPVSLPVMFFATLAMVTIQWVCCAVHWRCGGYYVSPDGPEGMLVSMGMTSKYAVCLSSVAVPLAVLLQWWARTLRRIRLGLEHFDIKATQCACEADREIVEGNIEAFVKHIQQVAPDASQAESLAAFGGLVRRTVPRLMSKSFGRLGVRYRIALFLYIQNMYQPFDDVSAMIYMGAERTDIALAVLKGLFACFIQGPLMVAAGANFARETAKYQGVCGVAMTAMNAIVIMWTDHMLNIPDAILNQQRPTDPTHLAGYVLYCSSLGLITYLIYNRFGGAARVCDDKASAAKVDSRPAEAREQRSDQIFVASV